MLILSHSPGVLFLDVMISHSHFATPAHAMISYAFLKSIFDQEVSRHIDHNSI